MIRGIGSLVVERLRNTAHWFSRDLDAYANVYVAAFNLVQVLQLDVKHPAYAQLAELQAAIDASIGGADVEG